MQLVYVITSIRTAIHVTRRAFLYQTLLLLIYHLHILVVILLSPVVRTTPLNYSHPIRIVVIRVTTTWCHIDLLLQTQLSLRAGIERALDFLLRGECISGAEFSVGIPTDSGKVGFDGGLGLAQVRCLWWWVNAGCLSCGVGSLNCYHFEFLTLINL